jgi:outer membrane protein
VDLYTAASGYDATYQAAKQQFDATLAKAAQAQALLLPTVGLSASANQHQPGVPKHPFPETTTTTASRPRQSASQPLYRPGNWASYEQGKKSA